MRALRRDDGFALVLALACIVVFGILTAAAISYTTSNQQAAVQSASDLQARQYAEAGLNDAYSTLVHANSTGSNPTAPGLLGTSASPIVFCVTTTTCSSGSVGSASVMGCYGNNTGGTTSCIGISPASPTSTWVIVATGYARKPDGTTISRSATAEVVISPLGAGAVAAVWNHVFVTAPKTADTCQLNFGGNSTTINVPLYVIGNLCLPGNTSIAETAGGQAVDLQVGGKLFMQSGNSTHVGASSTAPITSGVVVDGCTSISVTDTNLHPCDGTNPAYNYWVGTKDAFVPNDAPAETDADIQNDYNTFSPGPMHNCSTGSFPGGFDGDGIYNDNNPTVNLTPASPYTCTVTGGGTLSWDNTSKILSVAGSIFIDGNVTMTQAAVYSGSAVLEMAGTFTMSTNNISLCAVAGCSFTNWQGSTGNNSMLTIAPVIKNAVAITMSGNSETFQGSMWTQPSSSVSFTSNSTTIQGPISVGSISSSLNNTVIEPLPVIKNMPVGAPIPPNTSVSIGSLFYIK